MATNMSKTPLKLIMSLIASYWIPTKFYFPSVSLSPQMAIGLFQLLRTEKGWYCLFFLFLSQPGARFIRCVVGSSYRVYPASVHFLSSLPLPPVGKPGSLSARLGEQPKEFPCSHACPPTICSQHNRQSDPLEAEVWVCHSSIQHPPLASHFHQGRGLDSSTSDLEMIL